MRQSAVLTVRKFFELVETSDFSYREIAEKIGVSHVAVWKWKIGKSAPNLQTIENALQVLGYKLEIVKDESDT